MQQRSVRRCFIDYIRGRPSAGLDLFIHQAFLCPSRRLSRLPDPHPQAGASCSPSFLGWSLLQPRRVSQHQHSSRTPSLPCPWRHRGSGINLFHNPSRVVPGWVTDTTLPLRTGGLSHGNNTHGVPQHKATSSFPQEPPHGAAGGRADPHPASGGKPKSCFPSRGDTAGFKPLNITKSSDRSFS